MKKIIFLFIAFIILSSHDMFLKFDTFFLNPDSPATLHLYNGTFEESENAITRDRMIDVSISSNGTRQRLDTSMWTELGDTTVLHFNTGQPGTYVAGVSTGARNIELSAEDFTGYLEHDGLLDMLEQRSEDGTSNQPAVEKYSKHVKAIFQVGEVYTDDWKQPLGYPIEFIPQINPYEVAIGGELPVQLLRDGQPLANQLVYSGFAGVGHSHSDEDDQNDADSGEGHQHDERQMRTDATGVVSVPIDHGGKWYIRTIQMVITDEPGLTHESNWATLTFEVAGSGHGHVAGIVWLLAIGGILLIIGLYFFLKKRPTGT